jgi:hypothetical protein
MDTDTDTVGADVRAEAETRLMGGIVRSTRRRHALSVVIAGRRRLEHAAGASGVADLSLWVRGLENGGAGMTLRTVRTLGGGR